MNDTKIKEIFDKFSISFGGSEFMTYSNFLSVIKDITLEDPLSLSREEIKKELKTSIDISSVIDKHKNNEIDDKKMIDSLYQSQESFKNSIDTLSRIGTT